MRTLIFIGLLALSGAAQMPAVVPGVSHDLAIWRSARYSDVRYKLNLTLEKMSPVLKGTIEIRVKVSEPGAIATGFPPPIILDWRKLTGHEQLSTVSNITLNGSAVVLSSGFSRQPADIKPPEGSTQNAYSESSDHLIFTDGVVAGENIIKLDFTSPILTSGSAITRYVDKEDGAEYIYSLFVPSDASTAFPVFDQPDLKARFTLNVTAPRNWNVISNEGRANINDPLRLLKLPEIYPIAEIFAETKPISTYVFAFAAGPFETFAGEGGNPSGSEGVTNAVSDSTKTRVPNMVGPSAKNTLPTGRVSAFDATNNVKPELNEVFKKWLANECCGIITTEEAKAFRGRRGELLQTHIFVRKSQAAKFKPHAAEVFRLMREGVGFLESYFDYKFPFPKYDIVLIPEFPFGGMEHAGATFLREASVIFPQEPTKNDYISRANLIFHETAHQWFGDTVTMRWFDDLWLKEGFAEFMAYKTLEKVMPEYNAWKVFYERNKQAAYLTDSTKGTTAIYQPIENLSNAKSAYGNIVYRKAPSFLRQAEFYLGADKFQTAVRSFLKKHEYANAGWEDLVKEFETASGEDLKEWADGWVKTRGGPVIRARIDSFTNAPDRIRFEQYSSPFAGWVFKAKVYWRNESGESQNVIVGSKIAGTTYVERGISSPITFVFPNYQDYGYGIFLLDDKSRDYVVKNIGDEKDDFLRTMMWGSLWDSVREGELDPVQYVELVIKNLAPRGLVLSSDFSRPPVATKPAKAGTQNDVTQTTGEQDESTIQTLLGRVSTAMNYYVSDAQRTALTPRVEALLLDRLQHAPTAGQRITFYRAFVSTASTEKGRKVLKQMLAASSGPAPLRTKDKFDIVTRLIILGDPEAPALLAALEKTETSDDAKRYAYAARAGMATAEGKTKYWADYTSYKDISESWLETSLGAFNSIRQSELTLPYLERALAELPRLKRSRKIFFVNGWLGAFIGGQRSPAALAVVNKFLVDNPALDNDLRLKVLENVDLIERAVKIRSKYGGN